jgi:hypothetical protein
MRTGVVVVAIVLVLAAAALIAWPIAAGAIRGGVTIRKDARPWLCSSGSVVTKPVGEVEDGEPEYVNLAVVSKNMHCRLRVIIDNESSFSVTVTNLDFPGFGLGNAVNMVGSQLDGDFSTIRPANGKNDVDARFRIPSGLTVDAKSSRLVELTVDYKNKGHGCTLSPGASEFDSELSIRVVALGLGGKVVDGSHSYGVTTPTGKCS